MPEQGSSPHEGERLRPLTRGQVEDRLQELGDLNAEVSGGPWAWNEARAAFLVGADQRQGAGDLPSGAQSHRDDL
jgi:hypothetical protein